MHLQKLSLSLSGYLNAVLIFLHMKEQSFNMDFVRAFAQNGGFRQKLREYVGKKLSMRPGRRRWNMYRMKTAKHVKLHGIRSPKSGSLGDRSKKHLPSHGIEVCFFNLANIKFKSIDN